MTNHSPIVPAIAEVERNTSLPSAVANPLAIFPVPMMAILTDLPVYRRPKSVEATSQTHGPLPLGKEGTMAKSLRRWALG